MGITATMLCLAHLSSNVALDLFKHNYSTESSRMNLLDLKLNKRVHIMQLPRSQLTTVLYIQNLVSL